MQKARDWLAWWVANFAINVIATSPYKDRLTEVVARGFEEYKKVRGFNG